MTDNIDKRQEDGTQQEIDHAVESLLSIGRMWASHGLRMGRSALQTSARTLDVTAETLSDLARRFEERSKS